MNTFGGCIKSAIQIMRLLFLQEVRLQNLKYYDVARLASKPNMSAKFEVLILFGLSDEQVEWKIILVD